MRKLALLCLLAFLLSTVSFALAAETQTVNVLMSKLTANYALKTNWGNIYFTARDLHKLIHGAAYLRPVALGHFTSDQGITVAVKSLGYDKGIVTLSVIK